MKINQIVYLVIGLMIFIVLKLLFKYSSSEDVNILLRPTNFLFSLMQNSEWQYSSTNDYYYPEFNIVINKSCSGGNFFLICFLTFLFTCLDLIRSTRVVVGYIIAILIGSFVLAVISNVSRIIILLKLNQFGIAKDGWSHEAVGGFIYLVLLVISFLIVDIVLIKNRVDSPLENDLQTTSNLSVIN